MSASSTAREGGKQKRRKRIEKKGRTMQRCERKHGEKGKEIEGRKLKREQEEENEGRKSKKRERRRRSRERDR